MGNECRLANIISVQAMFVQKTSQTQYCTQITGLKGIYSAVQKTSQTEASKYRDTQKVK